MQIQSTALNFLDALMLKFLLPTTPGAFFIEAGANDGVEQSNLNGFDFKKVRPKFFLIETPNRREKIMEIMKDSGYAFLKPLSDCDDLFMDVNSL